MMMSVVTSGFAHERDISTFNLNACSTNVEASPPYRGLLARLSRQCAYKTTLHGKGHGADSDAIDFCLDRQSG